MNNKQTETQVISKNKITDAEVRMETADQTKSDA